MKRLVVACSALCLIAAASAPEAFAWRGGAAVARGPAGGAAVRGPAGGAAVRGPTTVYAGGVYRAPVAAGVAAGAVVGAAAVAAATPTYYYPPPYYVPPCGPPYTPYCP